MSETFPTHIALKRSEMERLKAYGLTLGAPLSPRQVVLHLLAKAESTHRKKTKRAGALVSEPT